MKRGNKTGGSEASQREHDELRAQENRPRLVDDISEYSGVRNGAQRALVSGALEIVRVDVNGLDNPNENDQQDT